MRAFGALIKKEWLETVRSGKLTALLILFLLFGIMNPAIAKLTPWMMEMFADSLADTGLSVTSVQVDALTSWAQFFKNIPIGIICFALIYGSIFTAEYQSGTLVLVLTKGVPRYRTVLAKTVLLLFMWSVCYWLSFTVTYMYNAYFWDNSVAHNLMTAVFSWWLFGIWVVSLLVLYSVIFRGSTGALLGTGGTVLAAYVLGLLPRIQEFMPSMLMKASQLLNDDAGFDAYVKAVVVTVFVCIFSIAVSIPVMNRRQI